MKQTNSTLALLVCAVHLLLAGNATAATQTNVPGPTGSGQFGYTVTALPNGNIVVTDPYFDAPGPVADVGAAYLYSSAGALISTLTGSTPNDRIGFAGVTVLSNGNYVVRSTRWQNGGLPDAGAVTWCNATTGCSGAVSAANSLVGTSGSDQVGTSVTVFPNGNYVVRSSVWDNGAIKDVGAVTWCNGTTGRSGTVSGANSLIGSTTNDQVGGGGFRILTNGNYVVSSANWDNGAIVDAGAATWCDGTTGCVGLVTTDNSLYGTKANDRVGSASATALQNGNYVVRSRFWSNGTATSAGAATWCNGVTGRTGAVSTANSLVGTHMDDLVANGATALTNGNYAVISPLWDNAAATDAGAVTWCDGTSGCIGEVTPSNSLVGSTAQDRSGNNGVLALSNGNYVVNSAGWNDGATVDVGAVTWCNGTTGRVGPIAQGNSLIGAIANDQVGLNATPLTNGHYVVVSSEWNNGPLADVGAVTWCNGVTGRTGLVSVANSLVGNQFQDRVGSYVVALTNGNYVVGSVNWDNGGIQNAGAATWCDGTAGCTGAISASNSLVGTTASDQVSSDFVSALSNGDYVVGSGLWGSSDLGAATWCNGTTGRTGAVSTANSLVGSTLADHVGTPSALPDGNYLVSSRDWDNGPGAMNAGAVTLGRGENGTTGVIASSNSVRGLVANGGNLQSTAYDPAIGQLVVGRPVENIVSLFRYRGPDFTVTTLDDHADGVCNAADCTLREAIIAADAVPEDDNTITFAPAVRGIIQLTGELPAILGNLTLQGPGANLLTVRRNSGGDYRIFAITNSTANGPIVKIVGLTLSNGQAGPFMFPFDSGGGILNYRGTLLVQNCVISGNRAFPSGTDVGGGIINYGGSVTIESSALSGNVAANGGAVGSLKEDPGTATITIRNSTLNGNSATGGSGGGIYNEARNNGSIAVVSLTNSTLSGNSAAPAGFFGGAGGAIYNFGNVFGNAQTALDDCTLSGNNAPAAGIYNNNFSATAMVTLRNTIVKTGTIGSNFINSSGTITSLGRNLSSDDAAGFGGTGPGGYLSAAGDIRNTDPLLGPLQNNGGRTFTHALLNGSPAINAGDNNGSDPYDQRGAPRVGTNDIGAFEFGSVAPAPAVVSAVSRKLHGGTPFDIDLPFVGEVGIECRSGGASNDYQVVVNFANAVTYTGASVSFGAGSVSSSTGSGTNSITVNLTGMTSGQTSTITLGGVSDGVDTGDVSLLMAVLIGDTNGNGVVNSGDTLQTRSRSGQATDATNFRSDVNADGFVNSGDTTAVRARSGTALPP